jgi:hypothetical protein
VPATAIPSPAPPTPSPSPAPPTAVPREVAVPTLSSDSTALDAIRTDQPPTIDGRLDDAEWAQAQPLTYASHPPVNDSTMMSVRLLWDDKYLYVGFDVLDTQVERAADLARWDGDGVGIILDNGGKVDEYRYTVFDGQKGDTAGSNAEIMAVFKGTTTVDTPGDGDEGYSVEMRIRWAIAQAADNIIAADLWAIDHDKNPGAAFDARGTVFSKISWDGDQDVTTAERKIHLAASAPPPTPSPDAVTLITPQDGQAVPCENLARGTYAPEITEAIWPVILVGGRYHPQDQDGQAATMSNGNWYATVRFGDCRKPPEHNRGVAFQLLMVLANAQCDQEFKAYIAAGRQSGFPGLKALPEGCRRFPPIVVTRQ